MKKMRWRLLTLALVLLVIAVTAFFWWLEPLLAFTHLNSDLIQGLEALLSGVLAVGGLIIGWLGLRKEPPSSKEIKTGGGAVTEGSVLTGGGPYIGRDLIIHVSDRLLRSFQPHFSGDLRQATRTYLTFLYDQHCYLNLKGLGVADRVPLRLPLLDLYIPLRMRQELPSGETWQEELRLAGRRLSEEEQQQMRLSEPRPVLEVLREHAGLVLLGDPGAGKSTFLKYLTLQMALGQGDELGLGERLPMLVPLAAYANVLENGDMLLDDFIAEYFCQTCADLPVGEMLRDALRAGRALVLLDGLDEVKRLDLRGTVVERAMAFFNFHRRQGNKFVLTSRIIGYREVRPSAEDLVEGTLVDLDGEEISAFVERWTAAVERQAQEQDSIVARLEAEREQRELLAAIQHNPGVQRLAANPMLLTILAVMKRQGVTLPERRVELYDQYVKTMLSVWNRARSLTGRATGMDLDVVQTVRILAPLALWMHEANPGVGLVKREDLRRKLEAIYAERGEADPETAARRFLDDIHEHTGLLLERGPGEYGFIHLTFEEYLAGVALALRGQGDAAELVKLMYPLVGSPAWREVLLLSISYVALIQQLDRVAAQVIETLAEKGRGAPSAIMAGEACVDQQGSGLNPVTRQKTQDALLHFMKDSPATPAGMRARAGSVLSRLGDPRAEVLSVEAMPFCYVPEGPFRMGSRKGDQQADDDEKPQHEVDLPSYWLAQYPVTNSQYSLFVQAQGYQEKRYWIEAIQAGYWKDGLFEGRWDNEGRSGPADFGGAFGLANHPVVGVSWYEALAFSRWLDELAHANGWLVEGWKVRLPSEAEWEKAARGGLRLPVGVQVCSLAGFEDGALRASADNPGQERDYPWNVPFKAEWANTSESGIGSTSAVGCFPGGAGPYGCQELSGNVWEWTRSLWGADIINPEWKYPYDPKDGRREDLGADGNVARVLRGGSWYYNERLARCACRLRNIPTSRYSDGGFRVAVRRSSSEL